MSSEECSRSGHRQIWQQSRCGSLLLLPSVDPLVAGTTTFAFPPTQHLSDLIGDADNESSDAEQQLSCSSSTEDERWCLLERCR